MLIRSMLKSRLEVCRVAAADSAHSMRMTFLLSLSIWIQLLNLPAQTREPALKVSRFPQCPMQVVTIRILTFISSQAWALASTKITTTEIIYRIEGAASSRGRGKLSREGIPAAQSSWTSHMLFRRVISTVQLDPLLPRILKALQPPVDLQIRWWRIETTWCRQSSTKTKSMMDLPKMARVPTSSRELLRKLSRMIPCNYQPINTQRLADAKLAPLKVVVVYHRTWLWLTQATQQVWSIKRVIWLHHSQEMPSRNWMFKNQYLPEITRSLAQILILMR